MEETAEMYRIPDEKKIRVIVDTDAACEADDPFAIAHAQLWILPLMGRIQKSMVSRQSRYKRRKEVKPMKTICPYHLNHMLML